MSAILLPFQRDGQIDWASFRHHVRRTIEAGLIPAVNMDTGYVPFLSDADQLKVLQVTAAECESFVAGAFVVDRPSAKFDLDAYSRRVDAIQKHGGIPVIFQSFGLAHVCDQAVIDNYRQIALCCNEFIAFELGTMFADFGVIYSLELFRELLGIEECIGIKHSSLDRKLEWRRLEIRNEVRPSFKILTGNDLAIDMVMYGSDYLLGLSTFCPELFAIRDAMWENGDPAFYELNDKLQFLGAFSFRNPTPSYKHSAAMFLYQSGFIESNRVHSSCRVRPDSDSEILHSIGIQLGFNMLSARK